MWLAVSVILLCAVGVEPLDEPRQGDGLMPHRSKRQAMRYDPKTRWPRDSEGGISYYFDNMTPNAQNLIREVLKFWEDHTCLKFNEGRRVNPPIRFFSGGGCNSPVGRQNYTTQDISLQERGCLEFGVIAHEVAHTLGFFHEHTRFDRDAYVRINTENVIEKLSYNMNITTQLTNDNYGIPYDYGSIMQYNQYAMPKNPWIPTVVAVREPDHKETMGQRIAPSFFDLLMMNKHYGCMDRCRSYNTVCQNQGFRNPKNCDQCICPWGFGGRFCETRDPGRNQSASCGAEIQPEVNWKTLHGHVVGFKNGGTAKGDRHAHCHWHIKAPVGRRIVIQIKDIGNQCIDGCNWSNLEIKLKKDVQFSGMRMCCANQGWLGREFTSESNLAIVSSYARSWQDFEVLYRYA